MKVDNAFIRAHTGLVHAVAYKFPLPQGAHHEYEDLIQFGFMGLVDAARRFDPKRGVEFSTYAVLRIRGAIVDGLRRDSDMKGGRNRFAVLAAFPDRDNLPSREEYEEAQRADARRGDSRLPHWRIARPVLLAGSRNLSIDAPAHSHYEECATLGETLTARESESSDDDWRIPLAIINEMPRRYRLVHKYRLYGMNLKSIAEIFGVTESRMSQVATEGISWYKNTPPALRAESREKVDRKTVIRVSPDFLRGNAYQRNPFQASEHASSASA